MHGGLDRGDDHAGGHGDVVDLHGRVRGQERGDRLDGQRLQGVQLREQLGRPGRLLEEDLVEGGVVLVVRDHRVHERADALVQRSPRRGGELDGHARRPSSMWRRTSSTRMASLFGKYW